MDQLPPQQPLNTARCYHKTRNLVVDYALFAAILGLNPFSNLLLVTVLIVGLLVFKQIRDVGAIWGFSKGQDFLAIAGSLFGVLGAFSMAFMAWLTTIVVGVWIPLVDRFAISAALFTWVWMMGRATNQYYLSGCENSKTRVKA